MSGVSALTGAAIFDGEAWHDDAAVVFDVEGIRDVVAQAALPAGTSVLELDGGILAPGFVDLQVNGGGGVMLNDRPDVEAIRTICASHARFGTTALLPTLITDTPEIMAAAVEAGAAALLARVPGFLGLHLEGPHLSINRKGAHDPALIRPLDDAALVFLLAAKNKVPVLLVTLAPESAAPERIAALAGAGIVVSLGHTDATRATAAAAASAGASMVTHLFNAMSQFGSREPGLVGAALDGGGLWAGLIADGVHVDAAAIAVALRAKKGPAKIFLVTDAMAPIGTDMTSFTLNGRIITRADGRLTLDDGTLAGADLDMIAAVRFVYGVIGLDLGEALRMASLYPAQAIGQGERHGRLRAGAAANLVHLSDGLTVQGTWIDGRRVFGRGIESAPEARVSRAAD